MIILRQKQFGLIKDIKSSGLKRTMKRNIGRLRNKIANSLTEKYIDEPTKIANDKFIKFELQNDKLTNPIIEKRMLREANKRNARVLSGIQDLPADFDLSRKEIRDQLHKIGKDSREMDSFFDNSNSGKRLDNKINNILKNKKIKHVISYSPGTDVTGLAHEIGHVDNSMSKNPIKRLINKVSGDPNLREEFSNVSFDNRSGIRTGIKRYLKGRALIKEESNASKKGLDLLKKSGITKEEFNIAKKDLDNALNTYKTAGNNYYRIPLINKIQIPSRRTSIIDRT